MSGHPDQRAEKELGGEAIPGIPSLLSGSGQGLGPSAQSDPAHPSYPPEGGNGRGDQASENRDGGRHGGPQPLG